MENATGQRHFSSFFARQDKHLAKMSAKTFSRERFLLIAMDTVLLYIPVLLTKSTLTLFWGVICLRASKTHINFIIFILKRFIIK